MVVGVIGWIALGLSTSFIAGKLVNKCGEMLEAAAKVEPAAGIGVRLFMKTEVLTC